MLGKRISSAVSYELGGLESFLRDASYSGDVAEYIEHIEVLGKATGIEVSDAIAKCRVRLDELEAVEANTEDGSGLSAGNSPSGDGSISDTEINSLFGTLVR